MEKAIEDIFPFEYAGGGYFRQKGIAKGEKAEILHGMEAIKYFHAASKNIQSEIYLTIEEQIAKL